MFLNRKKKINIYPCKPQFYYIKLGFKGVKTIQACFRDMVPNIRKWHLHHVRTMESQISLQCSPTESFNTVEGTALTWADLGLPMLFAQ